MVVNSPCKNARRSKFPAVATLLAYLRDQLITSKMHAHRGSNFLNFRFLQYKFFCTRLRTQKKSHDRGPTLNYTINLLRRRNKSVQITKFKMQQFTKQRLSVIQNRGIPADFTLGNICVNRNCKQVNYRCVNDDKLLNMYIIHSHFLNEQYQR